MSVSRFLHGVGLVVLMLALTVSPGRADPALAEPLGPTAALGTAITYQGRLMESGTPAAGPVDLRFTLHSDPTADAAVGSPITVDDQPLDDGYFTVKLDFGNVFAGSALWLFVEVRPATGTTYTPLDPRQSLTPAPQSRYAAQAGAASAAPWAGLTGLPTGFDDDVDNDLLGGLSCTTGQVPTWTGGAWSCAAPDAVSWSLSGNAGTTPGTDVLGTTDNVGLHLIVNSSPALRLYPGTQSPTFIGGYAGNTVTTGTEGGVIVGGGEGDNQNEVTDDYGIVVGGTDNVAGNDNVSYDDATYAAVVGGQGNKATAAYAFVGGGSINEANGDVSTVPGGMGNHADGTYSFAAGFRAHALDDGAFVWGDSTNANFDSAGDDTFSVRATGGMPVYVGSNAFAVAATPPDATPPFAVYGDGVTEIDGANASGPMLDVVNSAGRAIVGTSGTGSGIALAQAAALVGSAQTGTGVAGTSHGAYGVYGETDLGAVDSAGVYGHSATTAGIRTYGVSGQSDATIGVGVFGNSTQLNGYGVRAENTNANGVALDVSGSGIIRSSAETIIAVSPLDALVSARSDLQIWPDIAGYIVINATSTGVHHLLIPVDLPIELFGTTTKMKSAYICYRDESSTSYITDTFVRYLNQSDSPQDLLTDGTNRTGTTWGCFTVTAPTPLAINGSVFIRLDIYISSTSHDVYLGRVSLTLGE